MPYLGIFGIEFQKTSVIFEISTLEFIKNHTMNFGIGSAFSKGPGSTFSEGPGPGPGPLYKVCHPTPLKSKVERTEAAVRRVL